MPDAVIVATARTPIGRAMKGSLVDLRPDDLTAQIISAVLAKVPELPPNSIEDVMIGCGQPVAKPGTTWRGSQCSSPVSTSRGAPSTATARRRCRRSAWLRTRSTRVRDTCSSPAAWRL